MRRQLRQLLERTFDKVVRDTLPDFRRMENIGQGLLYGKNNGDYGDFLYVVISQMGDRFTLEFGRSSAGDFPIEILVFRLKPRELPMRCRVGELAGQKFDIWWEMEDSGAIELEGIVGAKVVEAVSMFARLLPGPL